MVRTSCTRLVHLFLVLVIAVASVQFASHSVRSDTSDPDLAAYLAAGGSLSDLCLSEDGEHSHADCPFCRDVDFFALAPPLPGIAPTVLATEPLLERATAILAPSPASGLPPARAPPIV